MRQTTVRPLGSLLVLMLAISVAACSKDSSEPAPAGDATAALDPKPAPAGLPRTPAPDSARVFFVTPADGDTVSNPVTIEFGSDGVSITKAGDNQPASGHHHLIIDAGLPDLSLPIPANDNYIHFGDGSSHTERTLAPGTHTLQLLLGDHLHIPHNPPIVSDVITITVE